MVRTGVQFHWYPCVGYEVCFSPDQHPHPAAATERSAYVHHRSAASCAPEKTMALRIYDRFSITSVRIRCCATLARGRLSDYSYRGEELVGSFLVDTSGMSRHRQSKNRRNNRPMSLQWTSQTKLTTKRTRTYRDDRLGSSLHCNRDQTKVMVTSNIATDTDRGNVHK